MLGDPCRPRAQGDRFDRRSVDLFILRGIPAHIRSDNGPEFVVAKATQEWIAAVGARPHTSSGASPWENGYIESFNARLRNELLGEIFYTLREAQIVRHDNTIRPPRGMIRIASRWRGFLGAARLTGGLLCGGTSSVLVNHICKP
jgi:transposase InsO family protein